MLKIICVWTLLIAVSLASWTPAWGQPAPATCVPVGPLLDTLSQRHGEDLDVFLPFGGGTPGVGVAVTANRETGTWSLFVMDGTCAAPGFFMHGTDYPGSGAPA